MQINSNGRVTTYVLTTDFNYLFTDWGIETLMIVKKADEEGTTTNADDWGIETDLIYWTKVSFMHIG